MTKETGYTRDEENISYMYTLPESGALRISMPMPAPQITWANSNTAEIWARVDKDGNVTHLDMDLCAKGPHNAYTALALAIWNKAIETAASKAYGVGDEGMYAQIMELKR